MCGLLAIVTPADARLDLADADALRMRDAMAHRGPDGEGLWRNNHLLMAHRRLAVIDPTPGADQPLHGHGHEHGGAWTLVYNGELYNDNELRRELSGEGVRFTTSCDTETLGVALGRWGEGAIEKLRGMYAFCFFDWERSKVLLARDPLGIKPLYYALVTIGGVRTLVVASEVRAILEHPAIEARPDFACVSSYLTTIRTTLDDRTMFAGVKTVRPGEWISVDLRSPDLAMRRSNWWDGRHGERPGDTRGATAETIADSVERHLRADRPVCSLLSGGLDSTIIASLASDGGRTLRTYCAGAREEGEEEAPDFAFARLAAEKLGACHTEVTVGRDAFLEGWARVIDDLGVPMSTPNEVAINAVAARLREDGQVVALSGEGADELFGGYEPPLRSAAAFIERGGRDPGDFTIENASWIPRSAKAGLLNEDVWRGIEGDALLTGVYREAFSEEEARLGEDEPLAVHLAMHRRFNLTGLLSRLDSATMLAGVEGRTPLADERVALLAESLPMEARFRVTGEGTSVGKVVLREAFGGLVPREIIERPKASFPLPFEAWIGAVSGALVESSAAREVFGEASLRGVAAEPQQHWHYAWPMLNVTLWLERWWGSGRS